MDREPNSMYLLVYLRWMLLLVLFLVLMAIYVGAVAPITLLQSSHVAASARYAAGPTASITVLHSSSVLPPGFRNISGNDGPPAGWIPTMVFLLVVGVLAVATAYLLRRSELARMTRASEGEPFDSVPISLAFEPQYAMLWDTQLPVLKLLDSAGPHGLPVLRLCSCYLAAARQFPELYDGCSFPQWLDFLIQGNLVVRVGSRVVLTTDGREFLHLLSSAREPSYPQRRPVA